MSLEMEQQPYSTRKKRRPSKVSLADNTVPAITQQMEQLKLQQQQVQEQLAAIQPSQAQIAGEKQGL